jgi:hypothetical protein
MSISFRASRTWKTNFEIEVESLPTVAASDTAEAVIVSGSMVGDVAVTTMADVAWYQARVPAVFMGRYVEAKGMTLMNSAEHSPDMGVEREKVDAGRELRGRQAEDAACCSRAWRSFLPRRGS